jgi:sulfite exporter TauE/SafE
MTFMFLLNFGRFLSFFKIDLMFMKLTLIIHPNIRSVTAQVFVVVLLAVNLDLFSGPVANLKFMTKLIDIYRI